MKEEPNDTERDGGAPHDVDPSKAVFAGAAAEAGPPHGAGHTQVIDEAHVPRAGAPVSRTLPDEGQASPSFSGSRETMRRTEPDRVRRHRANSSVGPIIGGIAVLGALGLGVWYVSSTSSARKDPDDAKTIHLVSTSAPTSKTPPAPTNGSPPPPVAQDPVPTPPPPATTTSPTTPQPTPSGSTTPTGPGFPLPIPSFIPGIPSSIPGLPTSFPAVIPSVLPTPSGFPTPAPPP